MSCPRSGVYMLLCVSGERLQICPTITKTEGSIFQQPLKRESSSTNGGSSIIKAIKPVCGLISLTFTLSKFPNLLRFGEDLLFIFKFLHLKILWHFVSLWNVVINGMKDRTWRSIHLFRLLFKSRERCKSKFDLGNHCWITDNHFEDWSVCFWF